MRALLILLLTAAAAAAAPYVRWVDRLGDVHVEDVREVLSESATVVKLRLADGTTVSREAKRLLRLVRERDDVAEERALLEARLDVEAGLRSEAARASLDRLAAKGGAPWIRTYAEAARVALAVATGEEDARARVDAALKRLADSRFVGALLLAQATLDAAKLRNPMLISRRFEDVMEAVKMRDASWLDRFASIRLAGRRMLEVQPDAFATFFKSADMGLASSEGGTIDAGLQLIASCSVYWTKLDQLVILRERVRKLEMKPFGALAELRRLRDRSELLLPECRSDIHRELAVTLAACGRAEDARKTAAAAVALAKEARDARRTSAAEAVLGDIASGG